MGFRIVRRQCKEHAPSQRLAEIVDSTHHENSSSARIHAVVFFSTTATDIGLVVTAWMVVQRKQVPKSEPTAGRLESHSAVATNQAAAQPLDSRGTKVHNLTNRR